MNANALVQVVPGIVRGGGPIAHTLNRVSGTRMEEQPRRRERGEGDAYLLRPQKD